MKFKEEINAQQAKYNPEMTGFYIPNCYLIKTFMSYEILKFCGIEIFFNLYKLPAFC